MSSQEHEKVVKNIMSAVEETVDQELSKLEQMDSNALEKLREQRIAEMKREAQLRSEWISKGHGEYTEIDEKDFFAVCKKSPELIVHFYKPDSPRCKIVDHHLKILAPKHLEAKFLKINAEKAPFLAEKLKIKCLPTLVIAVGGLTKDYIIGFTDLGNRDDFSTDVLERRLGRTGVIKFEDDLHHLDKFASKCQINRVNKRAIREDESSDSSD